MTSHDLIDHPVHATQPLDRASLRVRARRALRTSIITGEIEADRLYSVGEFSERLGVSATPIREALVDLEHHGLVRIVRNRGFIVPPLTDHDLDEIFQLRIMLELAAVAEIAGRLDHDDSERCRLAVDRALECAKQSDVIGFLDADRDFHLGLIAVLGNERLLEVIDRLRDQQRLYGLGDLAAKGQLLESAIEHRELFDAIKANDPARATEIMRRHLEHTRGLWAGREETQTAGP